ncbi:MAG: 50S ribosomal protein L24 [Parcubacteria group bacterium GW2011_GWF2_46_8]|nr:MAG: 50S ribosomal protein L24 [Parcubacteria group bacterium GW2011_GWF2_46_8]
MSAIVRKLKKGDMVQVLSGVERGKQAKVTHIYPESRRVTLEGLFVSHKHRKPRKSGEKVSVSKLQVVCPRCKKPARIGFVTEAGKKKRVCKKCNAPFV